MKDQTRGVAKGRGGLTGVFGYPLPTKEWQKVRDPVSSNSLTNSKFIKYRRQ